MRRGVPKIVKPRKMTFAKAFAKNYCADSKERQKEKRRKGMVLVVMTVGDLRDKLANYPENMPVYFQVQEGPVIKGTYHLGTPKYFNSGIILKNEGQLGQQAVWWI